MFLKVNIIFILLTCHIYENLYAEINTKTANSVSTTDKNSLKRYLLPNQHPLHSQLKDIFVYSNMFQSIKHFRKAGFQVRESPNHFKDVGFKGNDKNRKGKPRLWRIMVAAHPSCPGYLFKKFTDKISQEAQLRNYIKRIKGAEKIRNYINKHHFKHIVVPHKWLYKLPKSFHRLKPNSYILVVERMDIYDDWEDPNGQARKLYYNMDKETLTEFCTLLHAIGGCDAFPRNQPFTRSGKIAFIDTEHVGQKEEHFFKYIVPALNKELQAYAIALWAKLEAEKKK